MADWAALHLDILVSILEKVRFIEDFVVFGCVCKSWREVFGNNKHYLRPQIPWLMLADGEHCRQSKDYISMKNLYIPEMCRKCIGLNYGWVLTISRNGEMNLVHPLSKDQIWLPNRKPYFYEVTCAALSANPSQTSNFVLMIVSARIAMYFSYGGLGDQMWTPILNPMPLITDLIYYHDRFYGVDYIGGVWTFSVSDPRDCLRVFTVTETIFTGAFYRKNYIVVFEGDLLVVCFSYEWPCKFEVYKVDLINGKHKQIKSLGDRSIFVGDSTSTSVDVSEFRGWGLIESNHIYFADDVWGCYSLEEGQFEHFKFDGSLFESTFWFVPSF